MWKDLSIVYKGKFNLAVRELLFRVFAQGRMPQVVVVNKDLTASFQYFINLYNRCQSHFSALQSADLLGRKVFDELVKEAEAIEREKRWLSVAKAHAALDQLPCTISLSEGRQIEEYQAIVVKYLLAVVEILLGNETHSLAGVKGNIPAFVQVPKSKNAGDVLKRGTPGGVGYNIGVEDIDFFPGLTRPAELDYWNQEQLPQTPRPAYELLEKAYNNLRFVPHPKGSYVITHGLPHIKGVLFKTQEAPSDPSSFGFLARFDFADGLQTVYGLDTVAQEGDADAVFEPILRGREHLYLFYVLCQIYHDLVTADEVVVKASLSSHKPEKALDHEKGFAPFAHLTDLEPSFIYIPRKVARFEAPTDSDVRISVPGRSRSQHFVCGHIRRANMTEEQRRKVQEFERTTGVQVLKYIPPDYTFVHPHVSPALPKDEDWAMVPRYVKLRMEHDLRQLIQASTT